TPIVKTLPSLPAGHLKRRQEGSKAAGKKLNAVSACPGRSAMDCKGGFADCRKQRQPLGGKAALRMATASIARQPVPWMRPGVMLVMW
ncbi:MAG: hypothetical protein LBD82_05275, partial [Deltaproteobacteria bacterium]|nr:hypothetical protein [Deltaproteobacteria bacterium]